MKGLLLDSSAIIHGAPASITAHCSLTRAAMRSGMGALAHGQGDAGAADSLPGKSASAAAVASQSGGADAVAVSAGCVQARSSSSSLRMPGPSLAIARAFKPAGGLAAYEQVSAGLRAQHSCWETCY